MVTRKRTITSLTWVYGHFDPVLPRDGPCGTDLAVDSIGSLGKYLATIQCTEAQKRVRTMKTIPILAESRTGASTLPFAKVGTRPTWHLLAPAMFILTVAVCLIPQTSWAAESNPARVIRSRAHRVHTPHKRRVWVAVQKPARARVTHFHHLPRFDVPQRELVEVQLIQSTIYIDPNADYLHQGNGRIDANSIIPTAQRLYRSLSAKPARIVVRNEAHRAPQRRRSTVSRPHMILMKPPHLQKPNRNKKPGKRQIPSVPGPPKKQPRLMAMTAGDIYL